MIEGVEKLKLQLYLHALPHLYILLERHVNVVNEVSADTTKPKWQCPQVADRRRGRECCCIEPLARGPLAAWDCNSASDIEEIARSDCGGYVVRPKSDWKATLGLIRSANLPTAKDGIRNPTWLREKPLVLAEWECVHRA